MKSVRNIAVGVAAAALLSACANVGKIQAMSAPDIQRQVTVERSRFDSAATYSGPVITEDRGLLSFSASNLRGWKQPDGSNQLFQVYVRIRYNATNWRFYDSASFVGGATLDVTDISRNTEGCQSFGCTFEEIVGVSLTRPELMRFLNSGLEVRINSPADAFVVKFTGNYIKGFLAAFDAG